jgi:hydrogenase-4 component E
VLLALLPLFMPPMDFSVHILILSAGSLVIKAILMPVMLFRAIREVNIRTEISSYIPFSASMLTGLLIVMLSFWLSSRLDLPVTVSSSLWVPTALAAVMIGLLILVTRKKAITQVLGYLVMENGIFILGIALSARMPFLVEMGVLLDVFVAVFIMGIIINHIKEFFDDLNVEKMNTLKD